jgi:tetratricopeptide (TPR) repeat protein
MVTMNKIPKEKPILILIIATSFGEADWILPVLSFLKKQHTEWEIVTVFGSSEVYQSVTEQSALAHLFHEISSINIAQNQINQLFTENIDANQVKIILKDYNKDEWAPFKWQIASQCPGALLVNFPHSTYFYSNKETDKVQAAADPDGWSLHDIFLLSSENDIPHWSQHVATNKIKVCGHPRYDVWWRDNLLTSKLFIDSKEAEAAKTAERVFFHISRGDHPHYLDRSDYEYLIKSICEQVFSIPGSLLLIKPHPRQDIIDLHNLLKAYDPDRYIISHLHLMQLASLAQVIISFWSSGILDTLAVNKPVIEFWRFNDKHNWRKKTGGEKTSIYRELGLACPANTERELKEALLSMLSNPEPFVQKQGDAFKIHCKVTDNASRTTVNCLLSELEKKEMEYEKKINTPAFKTIIDQQIISGERLIEQNALEKAAQYFEVLNAWYPDNARIVNNYGVATYLLGNIQEAENIFLENLASHPENIDTAVNLVDLFLSRGLDDKALQIVMDYLSSAPTKSAKQEMEQMAVIRPFTESQLQAITSALANM